MISLNPIRIDGTVQLYAIEITEKLCKPFCENASIQPVVDVQFTIEDTHFVDGFLFVTLKAQGVITYVQQNGCKCQPCSQVFTEKTELAFEDTTAATVANLKQLVGYVAPAMVNCYGVAKGISTFNIVEIVIS